MNILKNIFQFAVEQNPFDKNVPEQCDPYSSFGVFCNTNSIYEGIFVIVGVIVLVVLSLWFVKKNMEANNRI